LYFSHDMFMLVLIYKYHKKNFFVIIFTSSVIK